MLPNQVNNKIDAHLAIHSDTQINHEAMSIEQHNSNDNHDINAYVNLFYENENEIEYKFYEYIPTQEDIDDNFIISTPKQYHR